ncbi:hypothetical protein Tco_1341404 [Tanacetum coccineum]
MPRKSSEDYKNTRDYIPIISHQFRTPIREKLRNLEQRCIHEGRVVFDNFTDLNYVRSLFEFIEFECLLEINEQVCPRFILEFYSQYQLSYSDEGEMFVEFVIQNQLFSYSLENFAQILGVPCEGACVFSDRWRVDELIYGIPTDGPYQTNLPPVEDIISSIRVDRDGQVRRIRHEEEIDVLEYQVLTREIEPSLKPLEEIIRENVFCLGVGCTRDILRQRDRLDRLSEVPWVIPTSVVIEGKTKVRGMIIRLHQPDGVGSKRHHIVPLEDLNGVPIALVSRSGVIFKSTDMIRVSHSG